MSRRRPARFVVAALSVPLVAAAVLVPSLTASAGSKPKPVKGACTHLSGNFGGTPVPTLSGCSPSPNAPGTGTFTFPMGGQTSGTSVIHWAGGATTTFFFTTKTVTSSVTKTKKGVASTVANPKYHCPNYGLSSGIQASLKANITAQHLVPASDTGLKGKIKATVCVNLNNGNIVLLPGSTFAL